MTTLPNNFTVRAPTPDDAQTVTDMLVVRDIDEFGKPETTVQDVLSAWRRKNFDPATDAWMVFAPDATLVAYADVWRSRGLVYLNNNSGVHPDYKNRGLADWILERAEAWAREHVTDERIILRHVVNADNAAVVERMTRWGYQPVRNAWVMQRMLDKAPPLPHVPDGIVVRPFQRGRDERAVWACIQETFRDLWQHKDSPYDEWAGFVLQNASWSPELSYLAFERDELAGATITMNDDLGGWVQQVGVRRPWRGRGIGLALLHTVFGELYKLAVPHVGLEVDAQNPSGALRLYERAGMHVQERFTEFRKELDAVPVLA